MQSIVKIIEEIKPHTNADTLELVKLEGLIWQVVVKQGIHKVGDKVIFIQIDSVAPQTPEFEFLKHNNYRVKTVKLRGELSQGLIMPFSAFNLNPDEYDVNECMDDVINVVHYEKPIPLELSGQVKGNFPPEIPKTDEERIQNIPHIIDEFIGKPYYVTIKHNGTSGTFYRDLNGELHVCGRNLNYKEDEKNVYWRMARKYNLDKILQHGEGIQAEIVGPGINKNMDDLKSHEIRVFNFHKMATNNLFTTMGEMVAFCTIHNLPMADLYQIGDAFPSDWTVDKLLDIADTVDYQSGKKAEGLVYRLQEEPHKSFKVISNKYLLKEKRMKELCKLLAGSRLYGLHKETSDHDYRSVSLNTEVSKIIGLQRFKAKADVTDKIDTTDYEFLHFLSLLRNANTNALEIVYAPESVFSLIDPKFKSLVIDNKTKLFNSEDLFKVLCGYAKGEYGRTFGLATGKLGEFRKNEIKKYGYCPKNAVHSLRLLNTGINFYKTGNYTVCINEFDEYVYDLLMEIKFSPEAFTPETIDELFKQTEKNLFVTFDNKKNTNYNFFNVDEKYVEHVLLEMYMPTLKLAHTLSTEKF